MGNELYEFVGICHYTNMQTDVTIEMAVSIVASTKSEALGMLLEKYPDSHAMHWDIIGGKTDDVTNYGIVDVYIRNESSYWG